ncbi:2-hydroxychromene-2-carboxylate isomerase [Polymorphobacter fuscus]|uniref:2-hydroxychromene-2-carboxylate isomerase n=2 Tax=Sandarakinorhabdus fusca TaxID=1439888 RepID=A0A7C9GXH7_9SPHN|nr:2-hydroxychromene-2-carboxylate isomerase [Polymorphobacter fuscus]KAB7648054.1 2-hydroxychromene-2-carboxylate isomerase [Polymorphobacter fuscus]MQT17294.1 2-hydroxychromene-2-carboxylate isomerase [Polymorphobacter fuscus]
MDRKVEFFFDCSSPWTYLGFETLVAAARADGFGVCFRPFLVGGVFNTVNTSVYEMRAAAANPKTAYFWKDLNDWITRSGLAITWPPSIFPINSARAMRACLVAADAGACEAFARRVFQLYWGEDRDIADPAVLAEACAAAGLDAAATLEAADSPELKARLRANTDEVIARGGFGTPTFFVGGSDMYFGQDRIVLVRAAMAREGAKAGARAESR